MPSLEKTSDQNKILAEESHYLYIQKSQLLNSGNGLFTAITIYKDEIVSIFNGEILNKIETQIRSKANHDAYFMNLPNGKTLDCMHTNCFAKYANDAIGLSKSGFKNNTIITLDEDKNVCLKATRKIKCGEEIFCSYGKKYWSKYL